MSTPAVELGVRPDAEQVHLQRPAFAIVAALTKRIDMSGWQRQKPKRYVAGRRPPSPQEHERQRLAHEAESEAHQANSGGLDWLTTMRKKESDKSKAAADWGKGMIACKPHKINGVKKRNPHPRATWVCEFARPRSVVRYFARLRDFLRIAGLFECPPNVRRFHNVISSVQRFTPIDFKSFRSAADKQNPPRQSRHTSAFLLRVDLPHSQMG